MQMNEKRRATRRKVMAIAAGGVALGVGVTATLAAWTDTEWVFGGNGAGGPGIGTSTFEVQQNTVAPFAEGTWTDEEENPGGEISFGLAALDLSPDEEVYASFALRTATVSVAGEVELQPAVEADGIAGGGPDGLLFAALNVRVATAGDPFACDVTAFSGAPGAPTIIADGTLAGSGGSEAQALLADASSTQFYCFEVSLPADFEPADGFDVDDYMGLAVAPAWQFTAESE